MQINLDSIGSSDNVLTLSSVVLASEVTEKAVVLLVHGSHRAASENTAAANLVTIDRQMVNRRPIARADEEELPDLIVPNQHHVHQEALPSGMPSGLPVVYGRRIRPTIQESLLPWLP